MGRGADAPSAPSHAPRRREQQLPAIDLHRITHRQLAAAPDLNGAIHAHIAPLDALLGFAAGGYQALILEELVEFQGGLWRQR